MAVALRYASTQPNKTVTFDFGSHDVLSYVVGIACWEFTFGSDDHHVKTLALNLQTNKINMHSVSTKVNATLSDNSGNNIDNESSKVVVCCLALVDSADSDLTLAAADRIDNDGTSGAIALPGSKLSISTSSLSGFYLSYGANDHHVQAIDTTAGFKANGNQGYITAQAQMSDHSGNSASTAYINGALIAADPSEKGIFSSGAPDTQTTDDVVIEFGMSISDAAVLLQDLTMGFDGDHHVKTHGGGCADWTVHSTSVALHGAQAFMKDNSGNNQVNADSSVTMVVVAVP